MFKPTAKQLRKIKRDQTRFDKSWCLDIYKKQIVRKPRSLIRRLWEKMRPRKFSVYAFYWWSKHQWLNNSNARKFLFPIKSDNLPIRGVPMKYELQGGWTFLDEELRFLFDGPLVSENHLTEILVPADAGLKKFQRLANEWRSVIAIIFAALGYFFK